MTAMTLHRLLRLVTGALLLGAPVAGWAWSRTGTESSGRSRPRTTTEADPPLERGVLDSLRQVGVRRAPFRASRTAPAVPYRFGPAPGGDTVGAPAAAAPPPRPTLSLTGIVWATPAEAILEGLPGTEGPQIVRVGEQHQGITIRRMTRNTLTVSGYDTTWTLILRAAWE